MRRYCPNRSPKKLPLGATESDGAGVDSDASMPELSTLSPRKR